MGWSEKLGRMGLECRIILRHNGDQVVLRTSPWVGPVVTATDRIVTRGATLQGAVEAHWEKLQGDDHEIE